MKITEQWLEEHGWEVNHYNFPHYAEPFHYATKMFGKDRVYYNEKRQLTIFRNYEEDSDVYADCLIDEVTTVEKLNATLGLCEVKEEK